MQLVCVVAVFIAALFGCSIRGAAGTVLQKLPPSSRVYLLGDTKTFTCRGRGSSASLLINNLNPVGDTAVSGDLQSINITWTKSSQGYGINTETTFAITMTMTLNNNGTTIWCGFLYAGPLYSTQTTVIAVTGPPGPPKELQLDVNMTALTLTWTAPWSFPVINYTVTVFNLTSNQMTRHTVDNPTFTLSSGNDRSCHTLQFSVAAMTDVGASLSSPTTESGFLKEIAIDATSLAVDSLMKTDGTLKIVARFEPPHKCSYETHSYTFELRNKTDAATVAIITSETPSAIIIFDDNIQKGADYVLTVTVQNGAGLNRSVTKTFNTGFKNPTPSPVTEESTNTPSTTPNNTPNTRAVSGMSTSEMLAVTGGMGMVILVLVVLVLVLLTLLVLSRKKKRTRHAVSTTEEVALDKSKQPPLNNNTIAANEQKTSNRPPRKLSIPQVMATNPMYEASTPIYEYVPERKDLRLLGDSGDTRQPDQSTLPLDIPPQLPVRKATLDSPGVKSTAQLVLDKTSGPSEEYMYMKAVDPRYIRSPMSPLDKIKKEESMLSLPNKKE